MSEAPEENANRDYMRMREPLTDEEMKILGQMSANETIAIKNERYKYKIKLFIQRQRLLKRSDAYIKKMVKKKFNIVITGI